MASRNQKRGIQLIAQLVEKSASLGNQSPNVPEGIESTPAYQQRVRSLYDKQSPSRTSASATSAVEKTPKVVTVAK